MNKNFLEGMGTVISLFLTEKETQPCLPTHSDEEAIYQNWQQVGNDLRYAAENLH